MAEDTEKTMLDQVEARKKEEAEKYPADEKKKSVIDSAFIRRCIWDNEVGDGTLYAELMRDRLVYNNNSQEWLIWGGHSWRRDDMKVSLAMTSEVVKRYAAEIKLISQESKEAAQKETVEYLDNLLKAARASKNRLLKNSGRNNCLAAAISIHNPLAISGDELNNEPWLLACKNGVINLKTGELKDGRPDQYITLASNIEWKGIECESPKWDAFLLEIFNGDQEKVKYFIKLLGYAITGNSHIHVFPVLYGEHGRNGKGTIVAILYHILGPMAGPIPTEMLLKQRNGRSSSGPSPDIMSLKGRRIAIASEPNEGERFDMGKVKFFTGGDRVQGRNPHDKYVIEFDPTHTLFLLTNEKPGAKYDDDALWSRIRIINFPFSYVVEPTEDYHRKADENLLLDLKEEASGILASLVRGCLLWRKEGLTPPESVKSDTETWRRDEDQLADFLDECMVTCDQDDDACRVSATDAYVVFSNWWKVNRNKKYIPGSRTFYNLMGAKFAKIKSNGIIHYKGVVFEMDLPRKYIIGDDAAQ